MSSVENTKPKGPKGAKHMLVSYGRIGMLGWFEHNEPHIPKMNSYVVIKTHRGLELGRIVGVHNYRGGQFRSSPQQVEQYYCNRTKDYPLAEGGTFVRYATQEDLSEQRHLEKNAIAEAKTCQRITEELGLKMKIIEAEHLFGGERIVFYFISETRIDFRELVKQLAREYQTRIELRQIGSRDEARLIGDYESCGQQCCCSRFLKILEPVNMRMAKLQKATLDPSKISGHCGRLKCCLRYEDQNYVELKRKMPHRNTPVQTPKGTGRVVDMQILTQLVVVQMDSGDRQAWPLDEIKILKPNQTSKQTDADTVIDDNLDDEYPVDKELQAVVTAEVEEMAEAEQNNPTDQTLSTQEQSAETGDSSRPQQKRDGSDQAGKRRGNKKRRRRSKNKKNDAGNNPNARNSQKPAPNNHRRKNPQKPSNGNATPSSGE